MAHGDFATTPVEVTKTVPASFTNGTRKISEWTLTIDAVRWDDNTSGTPFQAVVDSGNRLNVWPKELASKINADFDPPAFYKPKALGLYSVPCNAIPPANFGVQLGGKIFTMNVSDLIWRHWSGVCYSTVAATIPVDGIELNFLGDFFLKNVVAVFDVGQNEMRFAPRLDSSNSISSSPSVTPSTGAASASGINLSALAMAVAASLIAAAI